MQHVRALFGRPLRLADGEFLRREVAARMHERLALVKLDPVAVLDAGCGGGADLALLKQRYPGARVLGLDAAQPRLAQAQHAQREGRSALLRAMQRLAPAAFTLKAGEAEYVCGDFASTPLQSASVDLLWSNLALHWHPEPERVFEEWRRVLRVDGLLMFSCFGPDTLKEVRAAFAATNAMPPVLPFVDMHDLGDMLIAAGFATPVMDMETIVVTYDSVDRLLRDVRAQGGNPLSTRRRGLIGREHWRHMCEVLERTRDADGKLRLSYEVVYGHAFRPVPRKTASGEAVIRLDLPKK